MKKILCAIALIATLFTSLPAGAAGDVLASDNIRSLGKAKAPAFVHRSTFTKDLMFASYYGDYRRGFEIYRLGERSEAIRRLSSFPCLGNGEGTISHWKNFVFQALEDPGPHAPDYVSECGKERGGIRVVDVSDPRNPRKVGFIELDCGSHGITTIPHKGGLIIYNTNGCSGAGELHGSTGQGGILNTAGRIDVIEFDPKHPSKPRSHGLPDLFTEKQMAGCHDVTVYRPRDLAVCTGTERWAMLDISDPFNPEVIGEPIDDLNIGAGSAQFTWDGQHVVLNEIPGRGFTSYFGCFGPHREQAFRLKVWNVEDEENPVPVGDYTLAREPAMWEPVNDYRCHPSNFTVVPMKDPSRYVAVTSWGGGGMSTIDFSDPSAIEEIAYWHPLQPNTMWLATWYNGRVYVAENFSQGKIDPADPQGYVDRTRFPKEWAGSVRVLEVDGLGPRETRYFKHGLVTQWQDPNDLKD